METNLVEKLPEEIANFPATAMRVSVTDQKSLGEAGEMLKALKDFQKQTTEWFAPIKKKAHDAWKEITAKEKDALAPLEQAEAHVRGQMNRYAQEQERIRQEEERKARLAAEEAARKEREKLEAQALKALESGKEEKAEALMEKAEDVYVAPVTVVSTVAPIKTGNAHTTLVQKTVVEVTDLKSFVAALVSNGSALTMLEVKPAKLDAWVKSNAVERFPGLRIERTQCVAVR